MDNFQSIAALGVVFLTIAIFVYKMVKKKKNAGNCGSSCHCDVKSLAPKINK